MYLNDVEENQGPTACQRGSHKIPWAPDGVYNLHEAGYRGFSGAAGFAGVDGAIYNEEAGYAPGPALVNSMSFAAKAGDFFMFDIATFHTSMPNTSDRPRDALITGYKAGGSPFGHELRVDEWEKAGLLDESTRRMLGR